MRSAICLVFVVLLAVPACVYGAASSVDELAAMFDSSRCKGCHQEIYSQWEKSHHARSLMGIQGGMMLTPLATKGATAFSPETPAKATLKTFPCFKCHLPQALTSANDAFAADLAKALVEGNKEKVAKLRITCIVCHNEKAIIHRLELGKPEAGVLYSTKDVASHPDKTFKSVKKSGIFDHAVMCGQCHGLGPNLEFENPVQCATLYGSYQHNYLSQGGTQSCQECHMPKVNGKADHLIAPNFDDVAMTSELLRKAVYLDVQTLGYEWLRKAKDLRPTVVVNTKIWQSAGHRIPDG
ncbi:MAG: multiheme c-type cytochrome ExtKL [Thermodesulfovibrionales bacterium]